MSFNTFNDFPKALEHMLGGAKKVESFLSNGDLLDGLEKMGYKYPNNPKMTIQEYPDHWEYRFDVPGVNKEDLKVTRVGNVVTVKGVRAEKKTEKDEKEHFYYSESRYGSFERSFTLKETADPISLVAKTSTGNGVLVLTVAKKEEDPKNESVDVAVE